MWSTYQGNMQRSGQSGAPAMLLLNTDTDFAGSQGVSIAQAPVFGAGDTMYYATVNGLVECRHVSSRDLVWSYQGPNNATSLTLGADGTVYYGHSAGLSALSPNGVLLWTFSTYGACLIAPVMGGDGTLYSCFDRPPGTYAAALCGVSPVNGTLTTFATWTSALPNGSPMSVAYINGLEAILYPTTGNQIMPYATSPGTQIWSRYYCALGGPLQGSIIAGDNGVVYAAASVAGMGQLSACDTSGNILWTYDLNQAIGVTSTPALSLDGSAVYIMGTDLHAISCADGSRLWQTTGMTFLGSPVVSSEGYIGGINTQTGRLEFRDAQGVVLGQPYYAMGMATGPMSVSSDGSVFIAQTNGRVRIARNSPPGTPIPPPPPAPSPAPAPAPVPAPTPAPSTRSVPVTTALCYGQSYPEGVQFASTEQWGQFVPTTFSPMGLAVDPLTSDVYWAVGPAIYRCASAAATAQRVVNDLGFNPSSLALDLPNMRIFCSDAAGGAVCCINMASGKTERLVTGLSLPMAVAVDVVGNKLFWVEYNPGVLQTSDLTGQSVTRLLSGMALPQSLVIDVVRQRLYWACKTEIACCSCDGQELSTVITLVAAQPNANSRKLALDVGAQKLYCTDQASQTVQCIDLADGAAVTLMSKDSTPGFSNPTGIGLLGA